MKFYKIIKRTCSFVNDYKVGQLLIESKNKSYAFKYELIDKYGQHWIYDERKFLRK